MSGVLGFRNQMNVYGGEIGKLISSKDWKNMPFGNLEDWPASLTSVVGLCLTSAFPVAVWWGDDFTKIYNESFQKKFNIKHPEFFGTSGSNGLGELWHMLKPSLEYVMQKGEATESGKSFIVTERDGFAEYHFTFHHSPIVIENGKIGGVFTTVTTGLAPNRESKEDAWENELRMQLALQASALGTYDINMATSEFQYSDRLAEIFGYAGSPKLTRNNFEECIHPDDRDLRRKAHEEASKTGTLFYEARVIWPDRSLRWVRFNGHVRFDKKGTPTRLYGTALDVTESKLHADELERKVKERTKLLEERNEELRMSEERYFKMTEEVQDYAIILLDKNGTILNWNRGAENIKGYKESEIVGQNFSVFYLDDDRKSHLPEALIHRAEQEGRAMHEGWRKRKDGSRFWGSIVITALHDERNDVIGFTKVTRDLTERKMAEDMMRQHTAELEIKNKQLEQFAYIASHDLQEPLRKIQTFVQVLERKLDNPEVRHKYFSKIHSSAKRMGDLITAVLNYSRLSQSDELHVETDLNAVLEHVKSDYELMIEEKHAIIENDYLPTIKGVSLQLSQLFANLIGNSLKFSNVAPRIKISSRMVDPEMQKLPSTLDRTKKYVELIFQDNGIGFDTQYAEKIFTIFQRLNSREEYSGTGIGLALCKRIVENHHGHISASSQLGKGAKFTVYLPMA